MVAQAKWKKIGRKTVFSSRFAKVFQDAVQLPNGHTIDDYMVVELPTVVIVVATDRAGKLMVLDEYKYPQDEVMRTLPAGHLNEGEDPVVCAQRELLEETGYAGNAKYIDAICDYPTKNLHKVHVVRITNITKTAQAQLEDTENLRPELITVAALKKEIKEGKWKISSSLAALVLAGVI
jgi:ADP-ribose pyrophosphatase